MKQTLKQIGSLLLTVCMVFTLLPTMAYAKADAMDSGAVVSVSRTTTGTDITDQFTDSNFLEAVRTKLGKGPSDPIYDTDNFSAVTSLDVSYKKISSLAGIEYFTALTELDCRSNALETLDVTMNTSLTKLICLGNQLKALDVSQNTALTVLDCSGNQLSALDVSQNTKLTVLGCFNNQLISLNVSQNTELTLLDCSSNQLTALDVSQNTKLKELYCFTNKLTRLDVSQNTLLTHLYCHNNNMSNESAVTGLIKEITKNFKYAPQNDDPEEPRADIPTITEQPEDAAYIRGTTATALFVTVTSPSDGGSLSYQWYFSPVDNINDKLIIEDATESHYTPPTTITGTIYYFCTVTNTTEGASTSTTSNTAEVTVIETATGLAVPGIPQLEWQSDGSLKVSWDSVDNTRTYQLKIYKNEDTPLVVESINDTELVIDPPIGAGSYTFTVAAVGDGTVYLNSPHSPKSEVLVVTATGTVTTADALELKTALEGNTPATINVTDNIDELGVIIVGANHTLNIADGKTVSTGSGRLQIPESKTLTLSGEGTLKASNQSLSSIGIKVTGTLKLASGSKLFVANSGQNSSGVSLGLGTLGGTIALGTLVSEGGQITILNSGSDSNGISAASGTGKDSVTLTGGRLMVQNTAGYGIGGVSLTIKNNCDVTVTNSTDTKSEGIAVMDFFVTDSTVHITNTTGTGFSIVYGGTGLTVTNSTVTVSNSGSVSRGIDLWQTANMYLTNSSVLALENSDGRGLSIGSNATLTINASTLSVVANGGTGIFLNDDNFQLSGENGGKLSLAEGAKLNSMAPILSDRGSIYKYSGPVIVASESGPPSDVVITAGDYIWNGSLFAKGAGAVSPIEITGFEAIPDENVGKAGSTICANAAEVRILLQSIHPYASVMHSGTETALWPITGWEDTDGYNPAVAGSYTFTALLVAPTGFANSAGHKVTVEVVVSPADSGGNGGGSSSGGNTTTPTTPTPTTTTPTTTSPENKPNQPVTVAALVTATAGTNSTANVEIKDQTINDIIAKAQAEAMAQGKAANKTSVALNISIPQNATSLTTTLTQSSLSSLVSAGVTRLEINGAPVSLGLDLAALKEIQRQSDGNITISFTPATELSGEAKTLVGNRPVYNITISTSKDREPVNITSLGSGTATLSIPYSPAREEAVSYLFGVYVDANDHAVRVDGSAYDANLGGVLISSNHFSVYGVGYTAPIEQFIDIGTHWGKEAIDYVVGRGLLSGTTETTFAPNTAMTRGMLVTALGRLAGVDAKEYITNSFTDVKADSTLRPYIEWAYQKGIMQGVGNQQFAPDGAITREEIAVTFASYAKATSYKLPIVREETAYKDASNIDNEYKTAITAMQQAGIMVGGKKNRFNPKSSATRAELSIMLHRYIKLTTDPATAQGWAQNNVGQWRYYKDGKTLTGTQSIDGVNYFFNTDGTLKTGWVKEVNNWRYYSGNKLLTGWWDLGSDKTKQTFYFDMNGNMISGMWFRIDDKWYYFHADGSLAKNTTINGYEVDDKGKIIIK